MLARPGQVAAAKKVLNNPDIEVYPLWVDDLWARDTFPVFLEDEQKRIMGINFHFNGWGKKQQHENDAWVAQTYLNEKISLAKMALS